MADYYGIYRVVKYRDDERLEVVKTFDDPFTDARRDAYRFAGSLIQKSMPQ